MAHQKFGLGHEREPNDNFISLVGRVLQRVEVKNTNKMNNGWFKTVRFNVRYNPGQIGCSFYNSPRQSEFEG